MTPRERFVVEAVLFPEDGAGMTTDEAAAIRGVQEHSVRKVCVIVRNKLRAAGLPVPYDRAERARLPVAGREIAAKRARKHYAIDADLARLVSRAAERQGTTESAVVADALEAFRGDLERLAGG